MNIFYAACLSLIITTQIQTNIPECKKFCTKISNINSNTELLFYDGDYWIFDKKDRTYTKAYVQTKTNQDQFYCYAYL